MLDPVQEFHKSAVAEPENQVLRKISGWDQYHIRALKPPATASDLNHRSFERGEFWKVIPGFRNTDTGTFLSHSFQMRNSVTSLKRLRTVLQDRVPEHFYEEVKLGLRRAPMPLRLSPYLLGRINWDDPWSCPVRTQFIPLGSTAHPDHPCLGLDSLHEQQDAPTRGLTHRYFDKALFLPLDTCPVYCRFCTRSYAIGTDTDEVEKVSLGIDYIRWQKAFAYIASRPELEDIVVSGGDAFNLRPQHIEAIGMTLLKMPHIRRIRFATKGLAILPQKVLTHTDWTNALTRVADYGRSVNKEVVVHTHFNHPDEITWISEEATGLLFRRGITVRNQTVLQRGVNDSISVQVNLARRLSYINVQPYYVYICDMVQGVEELRTSVRESVRLEKYVRGSTAGFNTPRFICDAPEGGGKRSVHSYEYYNRETGVAVYSAPAVKKGRLFLYYDPLHALNPSVRKLWFKKESREEMIREAVTSAKKQTDL